MFHSRIAAKAKDLMILLGLTERQAERKLNKMKEHYKRKKHQSITINEMCLYLGFDIIEVKKTLELK